MTDPAAQAFLLFGVIFTRRGSHSITGVGCPDFLFISTDYGSIVNALINILLVIFCKLSRKLCGTKNFRTSTEQVWIVERSTAHFLIFNGPLPFAPMIPPKRNSYANPNGRGEEASVVWPRPLGVVGRGERSGGGLGAGAIMFR